MAIAPYTEANIAVLNDYFARKGVTESCSYTNYVTAAMSGYVCVAITIQIDAGGTETVISKEYSNVDACLVADNTGNNSASTSKIPLIVTKHISIGGLSYSETADGKHYIWGNIGGLLGEGNTEYVKEPKEVNFTINSFNKATDERIHRLYILSSFNR